MDTLPNGYKKVNCPSCGAEVVFASSVSVFAVCGHCRTMMVRHDVDLETLGTMAQLPDDVSPLMIGTRGRHGKDHFEVIGRLKVAWSEGYWNEWFLRFDDGRPGWLAEAMGFFMLSFEEPDTKVIPPLSKVAVGKSFSVAPDRTFFVHDLRETTCVGSEGELPFRAPAGRRTTSVDLSGGNGAFANIEYSADDGVRLYAGRYVTFDDIDWSNLRDLGRELKKVRAAEQFKCPFCGGPISLRTPGHTAAVVCSYCGTTIDATNKHLAVLHKAEKKMHIKPLIALGSQGGLFDTQWEVTGFLRRSDGSGVYLWDEYLLFNPYRGFRWLTTADGHWNFVEMLRGSGAASGRNVLPDAVSGRPFRKFLEGKAKVVYVLGEFYWRVKKGDTVGVADYIDPPEILSCEADGSEVVWSLGRYVEPQEVQAAFKLPGEMPARSGIAPNQPSPAGKRVRDVLWTFALLVIVLTMLQGLFIGWAMDREVHSESFSFDPAAPSKTFSTPAFELPGDLANVEMAFSAPVSNDWMEASVSLVNEETQQSIDLEEGVEYYFGSDSDGPWTEGSTASGTLLSSVPGGRYHLIVQPVPSSAATQVRNFRIQVKRDVPLWLNFFLALFLLSVYPVCVWMRSRSFEIARWAESDFSPYAASGDDEGE